MVETVSRHLAPSPPIFFTSMHERKVIFCIELRWRFVFSSIPKAGAGKFGFDRFLGCRRFKERKPVKATESDEVKSFGSLEPLQATGHAVIVLPLQPFPKTRSSR